MNDKTIMKKLTKNQKMIVSNSYGFMASTEYVKDAKLAARSKYWDDKNLQHFVSSSPTGRIYYFEYFSASGSHWKRKQKWKIQAKKAAALWAKGKYKEAKKYNNALWEDWHQNGI